MWKIKHIFDGEYGCEECEAGAATKVLVTLVDEAGNERYENVPDDRLTEMGLDVGDVWPEE